MSAAHSPLDHISTRGILEGLSRLHQLVLVADDEDRILWMSDGLGLLCGGAEAYLGRDCRDLIPRLPRPEQTAAPRLDLESGGGVTQFSLELAPREGRRRRVDVSAFRVRSVEFSNEESDGGPGQGLPRQQTLQVAIVRPVEERERSEEDEQTGHFLAAVLDASPDAVIVTDRSGFIRYANAAAGRTLGSPPEQLIDKPAALYIPSAGPWLPIAEALQSADELNDAEVESVGVDGRTSWLSVSVRPLSGVAGGCGSSIAFLRDITHPHRMQTRLERKNTALESYVHGVSHDLRSPLVSLLGFSRLLREDYGSVLGEAGIHMLDRVEKSGRTMQALITDLLELSSIEEPNETRPPSDPRSVLEQIRGELKTSFDDAGVDLVLPESPPLIAVDPSRLYQVFSNLIGNALNHMGPAAEPRIEVEVTAAGDLTHILVRDNGKGIPERDHQTIFEIFRTLGTREDGRRSTGIGLAIVKKIAESHDGGVWVENAPGGGAEFHFSVPSPEEA